jgi:hypothetical protein
MPMPGRRGVSVTARADQAQPGWLAWILATIIVESGAGVLSSRLRGPFRRAVALGATMAVRPVAQWLADTFGI